MTKYDSDWKTDSPLGRDILWQLRKCSPTRLSIYLEGETGTGKEILARTIHQWSSRSEKRLVPLHCSAISQSLVESELFGHVKGAFTGAHRNRAGALPLAHNGTLFLDEIGDISPETQVKLLRFLENGEVRPVGSDEIMHSKVRVVCATHKPLKSLVDAGTFRKDLYYRLTSVRIKVPSLRSRPEDIKLLSMEFAQSHKLEIAECASKKLQNFTWPGNVRELKHAIDRAAGLSSPRQKILMSRDFDFLSKDDDSLYSIPDGPIPLKEMERIMLIRALEHHKGNRKRAARSLGVARSTIFEMIRRHQVKKAS